jgi:hypothetical protein
VRTSLKATVAATVLSILAASPAAWADGESTPILGHRGGTPRSNADATPKASIVGTYDYLFPSTAVGHSTTSDCFFICAVNLSGTGTCGSGSGVMSVATNAGSPFTPTNFRLGSTLTGSCDGTPVNLPVNVGTGQVLLFDVAFAPTNAGQFSSSLVLELGGYESAFNFFGSTVPSACSNTATTMCLNYGRFSVSATWEESSGQSGAANMVQLTEDTGEMWFFDSSNIEAEVKVIDGCGLGGHYWVFAGGLTNVKVAITVTDTATGAKQVYHNPQGVAFQPIQDTSAFSTCP